ncbi:MAG: hypothetical protein IT464_13440 [Planctomycetes bacterium]|nr:hypothetical protein [Planctomycetota bacterium]
MSPKVQGLFVIALLALLAVVLALDPRVPGYRSQYDPAATPAEVAKWARDLKAWRQSPTWHSFPQESPKPDFVGSYVFGKYRYRVDVQISGDHMHYISWGTDDQREGGAWYAVGQGRRQANGEWFSIWSCLDLSRAVSNGGGAWFDFSADRRRIHVRYYHDTLPFGDKPIELGEAVMVDLKPREELTADTPYFESQWLERPPEGRVPTSVSAVETGDDAPAVLWGRVVDESGNGIDGAAVKRRAAGKIETVTDARGFFRIELNRIEALTLLTAGKLGYYNGIVTLEQDTAFRAIGPRRDTQKVALATITLRRLDTLDHRDYAWMSPEPTVGSAYSPDTHLSCGNCHRREHSHWRESRHASMATNSWVRAAFEKDARPAALARGETEDTCTPCHSPSLASSLDHFHLQGKTLLDASGVHLHGNHCDFCHKIEAVPNVEANGVNGSLRLLRPDPEDPRVPGSIKRVFGPLPDVSFLYMGAAYNPLFSMGLLCASCHQNTHGGQHVQSTYSEWQTSKYAQPGTLKQCQDCHMPQYAAGKVAMIAGPNGIPVPANVGGDLSGAEIQNDGVAIARFSTRYRPLNEAHKHSFNGTEDIDLLRSGVSMQVEQVPVADGMRIRVTLTNVGAGHAIPTGHGLKRYVLSLHGRADGKALTPDNGLPADERVSAAASATTGTLIGRRFGDDWSSPYWREAQREDTRLKPDEPRVYTFDLPGAQSAEVKLILRRGAPGLIRGHGINPETQAVGGSPLDTVVHTWQSK